MSFLLLIATSLGADLVVGSEAFPSAQSAVDAAQDGDCVVIPREGAIGPLRIEGTQNLRIRGEGGEVRLRCVELPCIEARNADGLSVFDLRLRRSPSVGEEALVQIDDSERVSLLRLEANGPLLEATDSEVFVRHSRLVARPDQASPFATPPAAVEHNLLIGWERATHAADGQVLPQFRRNTVLPPDFSSPSGPVFAAGQEDNLHFAVGPLRSEGSNHIGDPGFVDLGSLDLHLTAASPVPQTQGKVFFGALEDLSLLTGALTVGDVLFTTAQSERVGAFDVTVLGSSLDGVVALRLRSSYTGIARPEQLVIYDLSAAQVLAAAPPPSVVRPPQPTLAYLEDVGPAYHDALAVAASRRVRRGARAVRQRVDVRVGADGHQIAVEGHTLPLGGQGAAPGEQVAFALELLDGRRLGLVAEAGGDTLLPFALPPGDASLPPASEAERRRWTERLLSVAQSPPPTRSALTLSTSHVPPASFLPLGWSADGVLMALDTRLDIEDQYLPRIVFYDAEAGRHLPWGEPEQPQAELSAVAATHYQRAFDLAQWLGVEPVDGDLEWLRLGLKPHYANDTHYRLSWDADAGYERDWATVMPRPACLPALVAPGACPPPVPVRERQADAFLLRSPDQAHRVLVFLDDEALTNEGPYTVPSLPYDAPPANPSPLVRRLHASAEELLTVAALDEDVVVLCADGQLRPLGPLLGTSPATERLSRFAQHHYQLPCAAQWAFSRSVPGLVAHGPVPVVDPPSDDTPFAEGVRERAVGDLRLREEELSRYQRRVTLLRGAHAHTIDAEYSATLQFAGDLNGDGHTDALFDTQDPMCFGTQLLLSAPDGWTVAVREDHCD